jgi:hypothetical protein
MKLVEKRGYFYVCEDDGTIIKKTSDKKEALSLMGETSGSKEKESSNKKESPVKETKKPIKKTYGKTTLGISKKDTSSKSKEK